MYTQHNELRLFDEKPLSEYFAERTRELESQVYGETESYILNVNEETYVEHLVQKYAVEVLAFDFDGLSAEQHECAIRAEDFPGRGFVFDVTRGKRYPKPVVVFHLPFTGNAALLGLRPGAYFTPPLDVGREGYAINFEIIRFFQDERDNVPERLEIAKKQIRDLQKNVTDDVERYNKSLCGIARSKLDERKRRILEKHSFLGSIGVPIRKRPNMPETFAVPAPRPPRNALVKPMVTEQGYEPEPALDETTYRDILLTVHNVGKEFERHPATYAGKSEEQLRDHFLFVLQAHYQGTSTGETFNKQGKTDILIRYENSNVFIAECKFWGGEKHFLDALTQLISRYLTWRDSKAAVIVFVRSKAFSPVLTSVERVAPLHSNYLGFVNKSDESWFNFRFHVDGDPNRAIRLAVLLFHLPPQPKPRKVIRKAGKSQ